MSIEITGPQKYLFQDRVCVLLALIHADDPNASLEIEPKDGEDAQLTFNLGGQQRILEIQIKGEKGTVDAIKLADWLSHFPNRKADNPLIERLINDRSRMAVIIASGRCDDLSSPNVAEFDALMPDHPPGTIKTANAAASHAGFVKFGTKASSNDGPLKTKQRAYIAAMFSATRTDLKELLHRLLVVERFGENEVKQMCIETLTTIHRAVPDRIEAVLLKIQGIVFNGKRSVNILPQVRAAIHDARAGDPLTRDDYLQRGDEGFLKEKIAREKVLLIAGPPRIGKTTTARWLAAELQHQGFRAKATDDIEAVERFLMEPVKEPRVAIVDDPFGGMHFAEDAARNLARLDALIPVLAKNRRLIVAQAQDRLLEISRLKTVDAIRTGGVLWVNLTALNGTFLARIWTQACQAHGVREAFATRVRDALDASELVLEPGCLIYLAVNHRGLPDDADLQGITRLAREDAGSLGRALRAEGSEALASALAVTTTSDLRVSSSELAFALGEGGPERPGESRVNSTLTSFGRKSSPLVGCLHTYNPSPLLSAADAVRLESLEIRRIVNESPDKTYTFTHPFYRAGSESLLDAATAKSQARAIELLNRGLFCQRRLNIDPPCRTNIDPGRVAGV